MSDPAEKYFLQPGCIFVSEEPYMIHTVLGSCIAVCLWDSVRRYGGMNHYIYSRSTGGDRNVRYGDVSIRHMIALMVENGSRHADLKAHVTGGGFNPELGPQIGRDNAAVALELLDEKGISILTSDVGGQTGRKIVFNNMTGEIIVYKGINVRKGDWYGSYGG